MKSDASLRGYFLQPVMRDKSLECALQRQQFSLLEMTEEVHVIGVRQGGKLRHQGHALLCEQQHRKRPVNPS